MTSEEVSVLLKMSVEGGQVRKLCAAGRILDPDTMRPIVKAGRDWVIPLPFILLNRRRNGFWNVTTRGKGRFSRMEHVTEDGMLVDIVLSTRTPEKWRFVDLETGEVWRWEDRRFRRDQSMELLNDGTSPVTADV